MDNPYSPASSVYDPSAYRAAGGGVDPLAMQALQGTKPWVRLCSVMGFIGAGLMLLVAVGMMIAGVAMPLASQRSSGMAGVPMLALAGVYFVLGVVYFFPALKLWKYGSAIVRLLERHQPGDLIDALEQQRSFWKFVGILILVMIALYVVGILLAVVFAATFSRQ